VALALVLVAMFTVVGSQVAVVGPESLVGAWQSDGKAYHIVLSGDGTIVIGCEECSARAVVEIVDDRTIIAHWERGDGSAELVIGYVDYDEIGIAAAIAWEDGNVYERVVTERRPDLVVTDFWRDGDLVQFQVLNAGEAIAGSFVAELLVEGLAVAQQVGPELSPGDRWNGDFAVPSECARVKLPLAVVADAEDVVAEADEGNNLREEVWKCDEIAPLIVVGPIVDEITEHSARIVWETNEITSGLVLFDSLAGSLRAEQEVSELGTSHAIVLRGLAPSSTYRFVVQATDLSGNVATSTDSLFATEASPDFKGPLVSIVDPGELSGKVIVTADASDGTGVERIEFFLDGERVFTDYSHPFEWNVDTTAYADGDYRLTTKAFDLSGNQAVDEAVILIKNEKDFGAPTVEILSPSDGDTVSGEIDVKVSASDPDGILQVVLYADIDNQAIIVGKKVFQGQPTSVTETFTWDSCEAGSSHSRLTVQATDAALLTAVPGGSSSSFTGGIGSDSIDVDTVNPQCNTPPYLIVTNRTLTRTGSAITVSITVKNVGGRSALDVAILDRATLFQPVADEDSTTKYVARFDPLKMTGECQITDSQAIGQGQSRTYSYTVVPVLPFPTYSLSAHFEDEVGLAYASLAGAKYTREHSHPIAQAKVAETYSKALKQADYLIVTDPKKLFRDEIVFQAKAGNTSGGTGTWTFSPPSESDAAGLVGDLLGTSDPSALSKAGIDTLFAEVADNVNPLLSSMGELAALKSGALGYLDFDGVPDGLALLAMLSLTCPVGDWTAKLHPSFASPTGGYLLIVGENHIVPAKTDIVIRDGKSYVVSLSDQFYANSDFDSKAIPDLIVGRIIGNGADALRIPLETSIGVSKGEPGYAFDHDEALLISGQGMGGFYNDVYQAASTLAKDFNTVVQMHWRDYYEIPNMGFSVTFDPEDGLAVGYVLGRTDASGKPVDDIVIADASDHKIRFYDEKGSLKGSFAVSWWEGKKVDGFVVGDLVGDAKDEIIMADSSADQIWIFDSNGSTLKKLTGIGFDPMDGLAVGDVLADGTRQLIIARQKTDHLLVYWPSGAIAKNHVKGFDKHDVLLVGDIVNDGKGKDEIIMVDRDANAMRVFDEDGAVIKYHDWQSTTEDCAGKVIPYLEFYDYDEAKCTDVGGSGYAIGNCKSGGRDEIIVAPGATYRDMFLVRSASDDAALIEFGMKNIPYDFKPYDGLAIGELEDVLGVAQDEIVVGDAANDRIVILDIDNWVTRMRSDLTGLAKGKDLVYWAGHGNKNVWAEGIYSHPPGSTQPYASLDFGDHNPVVNAAGSCLTGNYAYSPDNGNIAEMMLRSGAGVYIGNTEVSWGPSRPASVELFSKWGAGISIGEALVALETMVLSGQPLWVDGKKYVQPASYWREWALKCNLYGDPKFGGSALVPTSLELSSGEEAPPPDSVEIAVPDYSIAEDYFGNGLDLATIPGGVQWQAEGDPWVPVFVYQMDCPIGYSVRTVKLADRSGGMTETGVRLPATPLDPESGGCDVEPAATMATGWFPQGDFCWTVTQNVDGTSTLAITVYPFQYNGLTTDVRFFNHYTFDIEYAESSVAITDFGIDVNGWQDDDSVHGDILLTNGGEAHAVVVGVVIERADGTTAAAVNLRTLEDLSGSASYSFDWLTEGHEAGDYRIVITLRDPDTGAVLGKSRSAVFLGMPSLELTEIRCETPSFESGDRVEVRLTCKNSGPVDVTGTLTLMFLGETGELVHVVEEDFSGVASGTSWDFTATLDTFGREDRAYLALGYAEYEGGRTSPMSCVITQEVPGPLLFDDFEDGVADGWRAPPNWSVVEEDDSLALCGRGHSFALLEAGESWTDYVLRFRAKLMGGRAHLCFRLTFDGPCYVISWGEEDLRMHLAKAPHFEDLGHLVSGARAYGLDEWHDVEIRVFGPQIELYVDGNPEIAYEDVEPILSGTVAFEPLDASLLCIDDVEAIELLGP
jgi:hypothetical protein